MNADSLLSYLRRLDARVVLLVAYYIVGIFGLNVHATNALTLLILSPIGIALAAIVIYGYGISVAFALVAFIVQLTIGVPPVTSAIIAVGNTLGSVAGAYILKHYVHFQPPALRMSDMAGIVLSGLSMTIISASIEIVALSLSGAVTAAALWTTWITWWVGDVLSVLIFAPCVFSLYAKEIAEPSRFRRIELSLSLAVVSATSFLVFWTFQSHSTYYLLFLPLTWVALRAGQRGTSFALLLSSVIAILGTRLGFGPFVNQGFVLEIFIVTTNSLFFIMAGAMEDRKRGFRVLEGQVGNLEEALFRVSTEDEAKTKFIAVLAHELRNPLATVLSSVELLKHEGARTPETVALLDTIDDQVRIMSTLLDDLLDISRISKDKLTLKLSTVSLSDIVDRSIRAAQTVIRRGEHRLTVTKPAHDILLNADPVRLEQIILNLLSNAAKYTKRGGSIHVSVEAEGATAVIRVSDNGIGIPKELLERIFEPFYQVRRGQVTHEGLGIGLSLTRQLVEMHGGTIEATSKGKDRGSEFIVRIPIPMEIQKREAPVAKPHKRTEKMVRLAKSGLKILVVDDNVGAATALGRLLALQSHDVQLAYTGGEAIEKAEVFRPDAIILDIGLPDMDGYEVARRLRSTEAFSSAIIALTGYGQEGDKERARSAGFYEHLTKPASMKKIEALLKKISHNKERTSALTA